MNLWEMGLELNAVVTGIRSVVIMPTEYDIFRYTRRESGTRKAVLVGVLTVVTDRHGDTSRYSNKPAQGVFIIDCHNI